MPEWKGNYIYKINTNNSNILQIKDYLELINFTKNNLITSNMYNINWNKISIEYDGIEINPYIWKARLEVYWYYGWDIASGCVWNLDEVTIEKL